MLTMQNTAPMTVTPQDEWVSPNEIVEDEDQAVLISDAEDMTATFFKWGDIVEKYIKRAEAQGFRVRRVSGKDTFVSQQQVYEALGFFAKRAGRTMRYYYETARFYPQEVREKYIDMHLDFSYFVVARSFGKKWDEVTHILDWAAEHPQADSETVRAKFLGKLNWSEDGRVVQDDDPVDPARATDMVGALSRMLEAVSGFLKRVRLSPDMERRATSCLSDFKVLLIDIAKELRENS